MLKKINSWYYIILSIFYISSGIQGSQITSLTLRDCRKLKADEEQVISHSFNKNGSQRD
jgi:hypothetical protein